MTTHVMYISMLYTAVRFFNDKKDRKDRKIPAACALIRCLLPELMSTRVTKEPTKAQINSTALTLPLCVCVCTCVCEMDVVVCGFEFEFIYLK